MVGDFNDKKFYRIQINSSDVQMSDPRLEPLIKWING